MPEKPKLSIYWASSCGGCEIAFVNLHERLLEAVTHFDLVFCPCLMDTKKKDVEAMLDNSIDITLFNGAIRTSENEEMAHLMRKKSKLLIAFGSCSSEGCIPGLSNLSSVKEHMHTIYIDNATVDNPEGTIPGVGNEVQGRRLSLPVFYERVKTLAQVTDVDYFIPGCPPEPLQIWNVLELIMKGGELPPAGSVIGAGRSSVCDECKRTKDDKKIRRFYRMYEIIPDHDKCLLEQGLICMGIATRDGCGALCPKVNMPCIGCYGPPEGVLDQGAKMAAALGSIIDISDLRGLPEKEINAHIDAILDSVPDYAGAFYKFSLAGSLLAGRVS